MYVFKVYASFTMTCAFVAEWKERRSVHQIGSWKIAMVIIYSNSLLRKEKKCAP